MHKAKNADRYMSDPTLDHVGTIPATSALRYFRLLKTTFAKVKMCPATEDKKYYSVFVTAIEERQRDFAYGFFCGLNVSDAN
jgi:hypothetical protein